MFKQCAPIMAIALIVFSCHSFAVTKTETPINLNQATATQLANLPGIGQHKAQAIVNYRQQHGKFASVSQLTAVKGIGDKILAKDRALLSVK